MRISGSMTSISWIPSEAISGVTRLPFDLGVTHYDNPPDEVVTDLDAVIKPDGARFANQLTAWAEFEDDRVVRFEQAGGGRVSASAVRMGGMRVLVEALPYPELRPEPTVGPGFVRFVQTAGGRPGLPAPRLVSQAPYVKMQGPTVWTTLAVTLQADGAVGYELVGASPFPRHWLYDSDGQLAGKSALVDFKTWYRTATVANSPWGAQEVAVPSVSAESALERQLSLMIMRSGARPPKPRHLRAGAAVMNQGDAADEMVLVLDGLLEVDVDGEAVAQVGPGSLLGERSGLESGRRTASVRAVTDCRIVGVDPASLAEDDLRTLASWHRREAAGTAGAG